MVDGVLAVALSQLFLSPVHFPVFIASEKHRVPERLDERICGVAGTRSDSPEYSQFGDDSSRSCPDDDV